MIQKYFTVLIVSGRLQPLASMKTLVCTPDSPMSGAPKKHRDHMSNCLNCIRNSCSWRRKPFFYFTIHYICQLVTWSRMVAEFPELKLFLVLKVCDDYCCTLLFVIFCMPILRSLLNSSKHCSLCLWCPGDGIWKFLLQAWIIFYTITFIVLFLFY